MKEKFSIRNRIRGFGYALEGMYYFFISTQNIPIYLIAVAGVVVFGFYCDLNSQEWLWIITAAFLMFIAEIFNSAIEKVVDKASPEKSELAKRSKDMAAAGVLMTSILSIIIAVFIFYPHIIDLM
ncbi:MAG: diacylglycerol kinase family protein [Crocinitomicaceae bacterium]|nr:diacylglycerol kinase family protein [Crocinitomicaceae bacterium]